MEIQFFGIRFCSSFAFTYPCWTCYLRLAFW